MGSNDNAEASTSAPRGGPATADLADLPSSELSLELDEQEYQQAEAFWALTNEAGEGTARNKGKGKAKNDDIDIEPEITPTEREAWAAWPTAVDEFEVQEVMSALSESEKRWLIFEVILIDSSLLDDAIQGFPSSVFGGDGIHPCTFLPGEMAGDTKLEEAGEQIWRSRMNITATREEWLLLLAQVEANTKESRDLFLLNLALVNYPFGQYLFQYALDLATAKGGFVASGIHRASTSDENWTKWVRRFTSQHRERKLELNRRMKELHPGGWRAWKWNVSWTKVDVEIAEKGWGKTQDELDVTRAGIMVHRPIRRGTPYPEAAMPDSEERLEIHRQMIIFEVENTILALLERMKPIPEGTNFEHARLLRLRLLVQLTLIVSRALPDMQTGLEEVVAEVRAKIREVIAWMGELERSWLELDPGYAWDIQEINHISTEV